MTGMQTIVKKLFSLILTVLVISFLTFVIFSIIPGNAALAKLGVDATAEQIAALEEKLQLNDPLFIRYGRWLFGAVQGDFGESLQYSGTDRTFMCQVQRSTSGQDHDSAWSGDDGSAGFLSWYSYYLYLRAFAACFQARCL